MILTGEELTTLSHNDIREYINYLKRTNSQVSTINRKISSLARYNKFLVDKGIQPNIVIVKKDYIQVQKTSITEEPIPTVQEINKIKHSASKDEKNAKRDYCMVSIFTYGGLRASELIQLKIHHIHLTERLIYIIGKGNKFRKVIINNYMYDAITEYLEERLKIETNNEYLFLGQKNINTAKPMARNMCNRTLDKYKNLCQEAKLHPHVLRAYFCTSALHIAGYTIDQVADQAGHSSLNTTKGYLRQDKQSLLELANNL